MLNDSWDDEGVGGMPGDESWQGPAVLSLAPIQVSARLRKQERVLRESIVRVQSELVAAQLAGAALRDADEREPSVLTVLCGELEQTERALRRLEQHQYGQCEICGQPIAPGRLRIVPAASRCDTCARATTPQ